MATALISPPVSTMIRPDVVVLAGSSKIHELIKGGAATLSF